MQQDLGNLLGSDAVIERAANVHFEFVPARQSGEHAHVQHASRLVRETFAQPDVAPTLRLGELDKMLRKRIGFLLAGIDVSRTEYFAAYLGALPRPLRD